MDEMVKQVMMGNSVSETFYADPGSKAPSTEGPFEITEPKRSVTDTALDAMAKIWKAKSGI